uniref:Aurora kinase n=1 Tax=Globisporangium ultimum (strain ATCC 200006 / CBS 805.95 / DAOM BR144) TaxID=431595 RepID=K3WJS2_GLOUD
MADNRRAQLEQWRQERRKAKISVNKTTTGGGLSSTTSAHISKLVVRKRTGIDGRPITMKRLGSSRSNSMDSASVSGEEGSASSASAGDATKAFAGATDIANGNSLVTPRKPSPPPNDSKPSSDAEVTTTVMATTDDVMGSGVASHRKQKRRKSFISPSHSIPSLAGGAQRVITPNRLLNQRKDDNRTQESDGGFDTQDDDDYEEERASAQFNVASRISFQSASDDTNGRDTVALPSAGATSASADSYKATAMTFETDSGSVSTATTTSVASFGSREDTDSTHSNYSFDPFQSVGGPFRVLNTSSTINEEETEEEDRHPEKADEVKKSVNRSETLAVLQEKKLAAPQRVAVRSSAPTALNASLQTFGRTFKSVALSRKSLDDTRPLRTLSERIEENRSWERDDFAVTKSLGKGKSGNVYLAKEKTSNYTVALKVIYKSRLNHEGGIYGLKREIDLQARLRHPNILRLYGYFYDDSHVYLILEYAAQGELFRQLTKQKHFDEPMAAHYLAQVVDALRFCHRRSIIHRDIKPENLLLGNNHTIKLADFGWSVHAPKPHDKRNTFCGTPDYLSPEILLGHAYDFRTDLWSLGVLTYELLVGSTPFYCENQAEMGKRTIMVDYSFPDTPVISEHAKSFIRALLTQKPDDRMSLEDAIEHPWLKNRSAI